MYRAAALPELRPGAAPVRRLALVTDAWLPQTNGVVTTLSTVCDELATMGLAVDVIHPGDFKTWPLPSYPEIRIARNPWRVQQRLRAGAPDAVHVATEGPLGVAARLWLKRHAVPFTTSVHTKFPEYIRDRTGLPVRFVYPLLRWFHNGAETALCTTPSHQRELAGWGMDRLLVWGRGVDTERFRPACDRAIGGRCTGGRSIGERPHLLYVGRIAVEKSVEDFLALPMAAEKIVVGDGPARKELQARFPQARWLGYQRGQALVDAYAHADVLVFPSRTDTFGLVMLEAMACGTPVAAYPVTGPIDVVQEGVSGALAHPPGVQRCTHAPTAQGRHQATYSGEHLHAAVSRALKIPRARVREAACAFDWRQIAERLHGALRPIDWAAVR